MPEPSAHAAPDEYLKRAQLLVVFATHNGAGWIGRTLEGYAGQRAAVPWALVVIDNASTDETAAILARYRDRLPLIALSEPRPGKNVALNTALAAIRDVACDFVFTDDDAVPEPDFVAQWADTLARRSDYGLFGGPVMPTFDGIDDTVARRYGLFHAEIYALNDRPEGAIEPRHIFGPNMAVAGALIRAGYRFDENIGPSSADSSYPMGSETEFCVRVAERSGAGAWFATGPRVRHIVRSNQATERFVLQRAFRHGRGFAQMQVGGADGAWARTKSAVRLKLLQIAGLTGSTHARWNAAWLKGYRAGRHRKAPGRP